MRPANGEGPTAPTVAPRELTTEQNSVIVADLDAGRKNYTTLQARLALRGYALHELSCGGYLIGRHDTTAHCSDLGAVAQFLRRIGGAQ